MKKNAKIMEDKKPLKRVIELQTLSHDHHHGLQLSWKIRTGFSKNIAPERIKLYTDWFYKNYLQEHFRLEEELVFTILDPTNKLVQRAIAEHRSLTDLFTSDMEITETLEKIEKDLKAHIRFEERELFTDVQNAATAYQLKQIAEAHSDEAFKENNTDEFWL